LKDDKVLLAHGAGGKKSAELTENVFLKYFRDPALMMLDDMSVLEVPEGRVSISTDTFVVDPVFFPGGNIGSLAVHGTVNDVAMSGAVPLVLSAGFVIEEGFPIADLESISSSMSSAAEEAGTRIVTADTKVVPSGAADRIFINTTGFGIVPAGLDISGRMAREGDCILLSGTIGDHGIAIASSREGLAFQTPVISDSAPLNDLIRELVTDLAGLVHVLRDPTRGGLASVLNEIAAQSRVGMEIEEKEIPVRDAVRGACELLGYDPLYLANEGKLVAVVAENACEEALRIIRAHKYGREGRIIGRVVSDHPGRVVLRTGIGGTRIVDKLSGEMLPRIC
jgi:hydrogenase expression/formation protein HypE